MLREFRAGVSSLVGDRLIDIVLFGSRARGEGHEESDVDVLVTVRDLDVDTRYAIIDLAASLTTTYEWRLSPLVRDATASLGGALQREIERDGVAV